MVGQGRQAVETKYASRSSFCPWSLSVCIHADTTDPDCLRWSWIKYSMASSTKVVDVSWYSTSLKQTSVPTPPFSATYSLWITLWPFGIQNTYGAAIDTLQQVSKVVESLYAKVRNFASLSSSYFIPVKLLTIVLPASKRLWKLHNI
jgi:hypothetical protein